jgi:Xaa-Pro aminopeptidase
MVMGFNSAFKGWKSNGSEQAGFVGLSFDTISSTGPNGAIIHYKPEKPSAARINADLVYLCDSGGQYIDGTTDVTRTLHFRTPSAHEKRCFTRVLQGHIAIDTAVFPDGTTGYLLDILARRALWADGLDFRHGTGHGVGAFLNVHEGPHGCGTRIAYNDIPLVPGMTLTNEPGYYEDGNFGIRIENVMLVRKVETPHNFGGRGYYGFEHVTLVPIQLKMIDRSLLTHNEIEWINAYHAECLAKVSPFLAKDSPGLKWLQREAASL